MRLHIEYHSSGADMTEIQYWDVLDEVYHSYLLMGGFLIDEVAGEVSDILEEMPDGAKVFITCGDVNRLLELQEGFEDYLLPDVVFLTPLEIMQGRLRGRIGTLIICDTSLMSDSVRDFVYREQQLMKLELPRRED